MEPVEDEEDDWEIGQPLNHVLPVEGDEEESEMERLLREKYTRDRQRVREAVKLQTAGDPDRIKAREERRKRGGRSCASSSCRRRPSATWTASA